MRIGVLGGTFDPPHLGHLELCRTALSSGQVDVVIMVPCLVHAFDKRPAPFEHRVAMCELLAGLDVDVIVSEEEATLARPGRTLDLLKALAARHPAASLRLVAGSDIYHERERWHAFDEVEALAPPLYVCREGQPPIPGPVLASPPPISSSGIRAQLARGLVPRDLLGEAVAEYIVRNGLYGTGGC